MVDDNLNVISVTKNNHLVFVNRSFAAVFGGLAAGILGFTGVSGFLIYIIAMMISSLAILVEINFSPTEYFGGIKPVLTTGITSQVLSYVLCWTLAYDVVNIF
eukprot:Lankesteria_metandrocarpae@DN4119_c0_g1_i1.p1